MPIGAGFPFSEARIIEPFLGPTICDLSQEPGMVQGTEHRFWSQADLGLNPSSMLTGCVTLGKLFHLSEWQFPQL